MRKTKIVCTLGPASDDRDTLVKMCQAGMNVARLNFSHGTHAEHKRRIEMLRSVREELGLPIALLLDTKGPEYRIKTFAEGKVDLHAGDSFTLTISDVTGDQSRVSVSCPEIMNDLAPGDRILLNNGMIELKVLQITETDIICIVITGGILSDRKSMSFPGKVINRPYLSPEDRDDIRFGVENDIDFIACSFVYSRQDLLSVKAFLKELGDDADVELIAKIENSTGVENIEDISRECSGIMIGRGDLGVEIPYEKLPAIQKQLITQCRLLGKRVITATEMLESMIHNPRPTRAEVSDVANAVYDGTSAVMLSGETAAGEYPVQAVAAMAHITREAEKSIRYAENYRTLDFRISSLVDAISRSVCGMSMDVNAKVIAVCTLTGMTARMVSRFRPPADILGVTTREKTWRRLALSWGVTPVICDTFDSTDVLFYTAKRLAIQQFSLKKGDTLILTGGITSGVSGNTNLIKVETV